MREVRDTLMLSDWFRRPRSLLTLYLAGAGAALVCLVWLALRQLNHDQLVEAERVRIRLAIAADRAVAQSQRALAELEQVAMDEAAPLAAGTLRVRGDAETVAVDGARLPFVPVSPRGAAAPEEPFETAELLEFGERDPSPAAGAYRDIALGSSRPVRAGALLRLARVLRKAGQPGEALRVYAELARLDDVQIMGRPSDLVARFAAAETLAETGDRAALAREAARLRDDLMAGRWPVTRAIWQSLFDAVTAWAPETGPTHAEWTDRLAAATAIDRLWSDWREDRTIRHRLVDTDAGAVLAISVSSSSGFRAVIAAPSRVEAIRRQVDSDAEIAVAFTGDGGRPVLGPITGEAVSLGAADTRLPWTILLAEAHPELAATAAAGRRRTFLIGLAIVGVLVLASGYFTFRGIRRELAMAALQSEFVSAVSHEFRTPLTSIRQLSHMLRTGRVESETKRDQYYDVLTRESDRLHRLVERLLSFGRVEAGRYRLESIDAVDLVSTVIAEFQRHATGRRIDVSAPPASCRVRADREMLSMAVWNLVDNAVKYSPADRPVRVRVEPGDDHVTIAVDDEGIGIKPEDRERVFEKFVRGQSDDVSAISGSGVGLAIVDRVVRAHGGQVRLSSEVGRGSSFQIVLPTETAA